MGQAARIYVQQYCPIYVVPLLFCCTVPTVRTALLDETATSMFYNQTKYVRVASKLLVQPQGHAIGTQPNTLLRVTFTSILYRAWGYQHYYCLPLSHRILLKISRVLTLSATEEAKKKGELAFYRYSKPPSDYFHQLGRRSRQLNHDRLEVAYTRLVYVCAVRRSSLLGFHSPGTSTLESTHFYMWNYY